MIFNRRWAWVLVFFAVSRGWAQERIMNFDHDKVDGPPKGWISDGDDWLVSAQSQASSAPNVLKPPHSILSGGSLAHLLISSATFLNGDVGVRFRTTREDPPVVFGILWSYANAGNYEEIEVNTQSGMVAMMDVRDGKPHVLATDSLLFTPNTWHLLQVAAAPKQLTLYLDNEVILAKKKTTTRKTAGQIGLSVVPNAPIEFDDFAWREN